MDFRYDKTKPSIQINQGLKLYRTTLDKKQFFLVPGYALFSTFVQHLTSGLIGTSQLTIPTAFSRYMNQNHPPIQGGLINTRRYVNPSSVLLEEYTLTQSIIYNTDHLVSTTTPPVAQGLAILEDVFYPVAVRDANGKFDAARTLIDFENQIIAGPVSLSVIKTDRFVTDAIEIEPSHLNLFSTLNNQFGINWESIALSYIVMVSQLETPKNMADTINKYILSSLLTTGGLPLPSPTQSQGPSKPVTPCNVVQGKAPMAQLICGQLNVGPQWDAIFKGQVKCTQKGFAIADSLIKVAATRIFAIPEQSIMEPIVNSLDAYNPARKVGKFGMGFFSLMYWMMRDPRAHMKIVSVYRHPGNPTKCAYGAEITNLNGQLWVQVIDATGTLSNASNQFNVEVEFGAPIDDSTMRKFKQQLNRLQYIPSAKIIADGVILNFHALLNLSALQMRQLPVVTVGLTSLGFSVKDIATGVPIELFYSSLVVPSISSKTIALSTRKDTGFKGNSRFEAKLPGGPGENYSSFRVLVGDIVIMDLKPEELFSAPTTQILTLPLNTRVPVSRDDVLLASVPDEVQANLLQLFESNVYPIKSPHRDVGMLENGLKAFINETASAQNVIILNQFLASIPDLLVARAVIAVPVLSFYLDLQRNSSDPTSKSFVTSNNVDLKRLEDYIGRFYKTDDTVFSNRKVILMDDVASLMTNHASAGGTTSYLFVDRKWTLSHQSSGQNWATKLASEYKEVMLYPVGTVFATKLSANLSRQLERFKSNRVKAAASAMAGQYQLALNYRDPSDTSTTSYLETKVPSVLLFLKVFYEPFMSEARFEQFVNLIGSAVAKSEPKVSTYGSKPDIRIGLPNVKTLELSFRGVKKQTIVRVDTFVRTQSLLSTSMPYGTYEFLTGQLIGKFSDDPINPGFLNPVADNLLNTIERNRELFDKASFYMIEIYSYSIELGVRFLTLNGLNVTPFTLDHAFNIPLELAILLTGRMREANALDNYTIDILILLLKESKRAYQYILASLIYYTLTKRLMDRLQGEQLPAINLIDVIRNNTEPIEVARVILSAVDNEFGPSPQYRMGSAILYLYIELGLKKSIHSDAQFNHLFHAFYKPALDVYGWLEKRSNVSSLIQEIDQGIPASIPSCYSFTLSQMVSYVFQEELPPTIIQMFDQVSRHQSRVESKLQIVEIASNEGASKDPIPGKMTETVQNALDAIRSANYPTVTIPDAKIGLVVKKIKGTNDLLIGISDPVGIPLNGLVALSIPFLSGKKPSEIVTGEIGSGFFNVYREAIGVFITTTVNGETTEILDTPILDDEKKRILDIQRCARVIKTSFPNGTSIFIQSRHTDETFIPAAIEAITFARDVIGLISEAQMITLNKEPISIPLTKVYENDFFEFHVSTRNFASYIMTKGVPFAPLHKYFTAMGFFKGFDWILDKFRVGVRLNVKAGVFTPVQTRTKIGLSDENTNILITSILQAMPFVILFQIENKLIPNKEIDQYLQYYSSTADAQQVLPGSSDVSSWVNNLNKLTNNRKINEEDRNDVMTELSRVAYPFMTVALSEKNLIPNPKRSSSATNTMTENLITSVPGLNADFLRKTLSGFISPNAARYDNYPNLNNLIQEGFQGWPDIGKIQTILKERFKEMGLDRTKFPGSTIWNLVYVWLITKQKSQKRIRGGDEAPLDDRPPKTTIKSPLHLPFCQVWINTYCKVAQTVIKGYPTKYPTVIFDLAVLSNQQGSYAPGLNVLTLAYYYMETETTGKNMFLLDDIIDAFSGLTDPSAQVLNLDINNEVWRDFFMPKGTIAHEMEHFRVGSGHAQGFHDAVTMNLPYGGTKKRIFLAQHHDFMMSLVQAGLYEEVRKAWLNYRATGKM